jgi:hypothetical protein
MVPGGARSFRYADGYRMSRPASTLRRGFSFASRARNRAVSRSIRAPLMLIGAHKSILGPALIAPASPAEAGRGMHGGTTVRVVVGSHHNKVVVVPHQQLAFNRFARTGQFAPFGSFDGYGFGGGSYVPSDYGYASPTVAYTPPAVPQPTPPPPKRVAANLPPCHEETPSGVTIDRGMGCSRALQYNARRNRLIAPPVRTGTPAQ